MKNLMLPVFCSLLSLSILAQENTGLIEWSPVTKEKRALNKDLVGQDESYVYTIGISPYVPSFSVYLKKYDKETLELKSETKLKKFKHHGHQAVFKDSWIYENRIHVIYTAYGNSEDSLYVMHRSINEAGEISEVREVARIYSAIYKIDMFDVRLSADRSSVLITTNAKTEFKNKEVLHLHVFNGDMTLTWQRSVDFNRQDETIEDQLITNDGEVYVTVSASIEKDKKRTSKSVKSIRKYHFLHLSKDIENFEVKKIRLDNIHLHNAKLWYDDKEKLFSVAGLYTSNQDRIILGSAYLLIDPIDFSILTTDTKSFKDNLILDFKSDEEKDNQINQYFKFKDRLAVPGKGSYIIAEEWRKQEIQRIDASTGAVIPGGYLHKRKNLLVLKIDNEGKQEWVRLIHKNQEGQDPRHYSYAPFISEGDLNILFNEAQSSLDRSQKGKKLNKMKKAGIGSVLALLTVADEGEVTRTHLASHLYLKVIPLASLSYTSETGDFLILGQSRLWQRFGRYRNVQ